MLASEVHKGWHQVLFSRFSFKRLTAGIDCARRQGNRLLELRATTSLERLLTKQGRRNEAHTMLADVYNWCSEGFDTADLKDAKALLEELGG